MVVLESGSGIAIGASTPMNARVLVRGERGGSGMNDAYGFSTLSRGGDGGNGIAQFHAPADPGTGMPSISVGGVPLTSFEPGGPGEFAVDGGPAVAHVLLVEFGLRSRARSKWIETGFAMLGPLGPAGGPFYPWSDPNVATNPAYPLDPMGLVRTGPDGKVLALPPLASGTMAASGVGANAATIPGSVVQNPATLRGDSFRPNSSQAKAFTIASASYDAAADVTTIATEPDEGPMTPFVSGASTGWEIRPRYFRVHMGGALDTVPYPTTVRILFEGADGLDPATGEPVGLVGPTPSLADIAGKRLFRFVVDFDLDASGSVLPSPSTPVPRIPFFKVPIRF